MKSILLLGTLGLILALGRPAVAAAPPDAPDISPAYFTALRNGDLKAVRQLLDAGASAKARDAAGNSALMLAAVYADARTMALLLDRGADPNGANAEGATPLMRAAFDSEKVALLLERGADVRPASQLGNTALILAARPADSHRAVELLLDHGADARATNHWGATALMAAAAGGDLRTVKLLIAHGADVNAQNSMDPTRLGFIIGGGRTVLMWAAFRGDTAVIRELLTAGADVNAIGPFGTALAQAAWSGSAAGAKLLLEHGAKPDLTGLADGYAPLHWAASSENPDPSMVNLLITHGADPNMGGGEPVDAFLGVPQTPLMLARRRGETPVLAALVRAGATKATPDRVKPDREAEFPERIDVSAVRSVIDRALPPLQRSSIESKESFVHHASHQNCASCHQQFLPMAALGLARKHGATIDQAAEQKLKAIVCNDTLMSREVDWQVLFHPEPAHTKGYALLAMAFENVPAGENTDAWVHHLALIQGQEGQWHNNLPRPPIQTDDIGPTALAIHALRQYPLPGRRTELSTRIDRARAWLRKQKPTTTEGRVYQILGLAWAGVPAAELKAMREALLQSQRPDGGWAQLATLQSDAYATAQSIYALRAGAGMPTDAPAVQKGVRFLLGTQLEDGTWHVHRRAFPFQPTMDSGFPHGRDSWISAAASSWAVMALSVCESQSL